MLSDPPPIYALSIKQPWAALVVMGLKTVEIRRWPTSRRGRILIHAARVPDKRGESEAPTSTRFKELAQLRGGIIGSVELIDCTAYRDPALFGADKDLHYNDATWFEPPVLYGFRFVKPEVLTFHAYPGWFRFFKVDGLAHAS